MLRQRPGLGDKSSPQTGVSPLDSDEQAKLVEELGEEAKRQTTTISLVFSAVLFVCGLAIVWCAAQLWFRQDAPLAHTEILQDVPSIAFLASYIGYLLQLFVCHKIGQGYRWHLAPGVCLAWTFVFSWLAVFRRFEITNFLFYWLPLGPSALYGVAVYIFSSAKKVDRQVQELDGLRYNHKEL